jgi:hypothetical protein
MRTTKEQHGTQRYGIIIYKLKYPHKYPTRVQTLAENGMCTYYLSEIRTWTVIHTTVAHTLAGTSSRSHLPSTSLHTSHQCSYTPETKGTDNSKCDLFVDEFNHRPGKPNQISAFHTPRFKMSSIAQKFQNAYRRGIRPETITPRDPRWHY